MNTRQILVFCCSRLWLAVGVIVFLLGTSTMAFAAPRATGNSYVRVVHGAPGAGNVDVFVDGKKALSNVAFATVSAYEMWPAGSHTVKVAPAGQGVGAAVITQAEMTDAGDAYTLAAVGTKATGFSLSAFEDNSTLQAPAKVRVYHLSPNAGPVNIAFGSKQVISGLAYKNASKYLPVPAGPSVFNVTAVNENVTVPVKVDIKAGTVLSVFALGLYKGTPALQFVEAVTPGVAK